MLRGEFLALFLFKYGGFVEVPKIEQQSKEFTRLGSSVADPDPGSGAFCPLDPGSGMGRKSETGSGIRD